MRSERDQLLRRLLGNQRPARLPTNPVSLRRLAEALPAAPDQPLTRSGIAALQRSAGNRAVASLFDPVPGRSRSPPAVQRDDENQSSGDDAADGGADYTQSGDDNMSIAPPPDLNLSLGGTELAEYALADLRSMDPGFMPGVPEEVGPSQTSQPDTMMAMWEEGAVQRDGPTGLPDKSPSGGAGGGDSGNAPGLSTDLGVGGAAGATYPWTLSTTVVYRNLNYRQFPNVLRGLDILHEPQATFLFSITPSALLSTQLGVGLVNLHLPSLFGTELEAQFLAQAQYDSSQGTSVGGSVQLEQHIWKGISATFNLSGMWTLPGSSTPAGFQVAPGGGITIHTDAF